MNPCAVSRRPSLEKNGRTHTRTRGPKVTATANLPGLIPISRNAQQRGKPCLSLEAWRESGRRHKSSLSPITRPPSAMPAEPQQSWSGAAANKDPIVAACEVSKPTTQKPRPDNCQGGAAESDLSRHHHLRKPFTRFLADLPPHDCSLHQDRSSRRGRPQEGQNNRDSVLSVQRKVTNERGWLKRAEGDQM